MKLQILLLTALSQFCISSCSQSREQEQQVKDSQIESLSVKANFTNADVWEAYNGFNAVFLDPDKYIYKEKRSDKFAIDRYHGASAIWCQPIFWEMSMNAYRLADKLNDDTRKEAMKDLCEKIYRGNKAQYCNFDFDNNNETTGWFIYDDIMWWTIALARGYELFGNEEYLRYSELSFSRVWYGSDKVGDTGSYDKENGGMFWQWQPVHNPRPNQYGDEKNACINFPTVIGALMLYNNVPEGRSESTESKPKYQTKEQYLSKGKEIYDWSVDNFLNKRTGRIADHRRGDKGASLEAHVYNQGTFIGASVLLYKATGEKRYLDNAILGADYVFKIMSSEQYILPFEKGIEQGIYTAIFAQYLSMLVYECGQVQYLPYVRHNINVGWSNRDKSHQICGGDYRNVLQPDEIVDSYSASGIPALMLLFPAEQ